MPNITPAQAAAKLTSRMQQSGTLYRDGVNAVTVNPAELAAAQEDKWFTRLQDAYNNQRFSKGLATVSLQDWKTAVNDLGVQRYTQSADKAGANYLKFANVFYPFLETVQAEIAGMPNNTLQDSIDRMIKNVTRLSEFANQ